MSVRLRQGLGALSACLLPPAMAAAGATLHPKVDITPIPDWVEPAALPPAGAAPTRDIQGGTHYLLIDQQTHCADAETARFNHHARELVNENGVHAATQLMFTFDPAYQHLAIHYCEILRDENRHDLLKPENLRVLQREEMLERRLFDGRLDVVLILDDVRRGDCIHYAYTVTGTHPVFADRLTVMLRTRWSVPVERVRYRIIGRAETPMRVKVHDTDQESMLRTDRGLEYFAWDSERTPALEYEWETPRDYSPWPHIQVSQWESWGQIADRLAEAYAGQAAEGPSPVDEGLPTRDSTPEEALRFVQEEIRYLGLEIGEHSLIPHPPKHAVDRRFGDCKDKALLLADLLGRQGLNAYPALVSTSHGGAIRDMLPSPYLFDHCILAVEQDHGTVWVDPTRTHQRGAFNRVFLPDYGEALVLRPGTTNLTPMALERQLHRRTHVEEHFRIDGQDGEGQLRVHSTYEGGDADDMRDWLTHTGEAGIHREYTNYYARMFGGARLERPVEITDDVAANLLEVRESYRISGFWTASTEAEALEADLVPHSMDDVATRPEVVHRTMPLGLAYPDEREHVITAELPHPETWEFGDENTEINNAYLRFSRTVSYKDDVLRVTWSYRSLTNAVPVKDVPAFLDDLESVDNLLWYGLWWPLEGEPPVAGLLLALLLLIVLIVATAAALWRVLGGRTADGRPDMNSLLRLGRSLVFIFLAIAVVSGFAAVLDLAELYLLHEISSGVRGQPDWADDADLLYGLIGILYTLLCVACGVLFLIWFQAAYRNLKTTGIRIKYGPGWAVGGFFVPILNLVRPYHVMKDVWFGSSLLSRPEDDASQTSTSTTPLVDWWWGLYLIANFLGTAAFRFSQEAELAVAGTWMMLASDLLDIPAALCALLLVRRITAIQERVRLRGPASPPPVPVLPRASCEAEA